MRQSGFTLVELIVVMVLVGIIGGVLALQLTPAIQAYLQVSQRANLSNQADSALRRMATEVRSAVPNSLRLNASTCLDLVPTSNGGRFRTGPAAGGAATAWINEAESGAEFDVLTPLAPAPAAGDAIVIGNRSPGDVYNEINTGRVKATVATQAQAGTSRIQLDQPIQVPPGYDGARFLVVPRDQKVVTWVCQPGADGSGKLLRFARDDFTAAPQCDPAAAGIAASVVASRVQACSFVVYANQGGTQDSGYVQLQLTLSDKGETVPLTVGTYVDNQP